MLSIRNAQMGFGAEVLFDPVSLDVPEGEVMLLAAPSGVGKSTLLHWICGTPPPGLIAEGTITLDGRDVTRLPAEARGIGIIFQDAMLFPHLSVWENLAFGMPRQGEGAITSKSGRKAACLAALDEVGLADCAGRDPLSLSGGQKARIALLRSLMAKPKALLLDEPFSGLDGKTREGFAALVQQTIAGNGLPAILVSHDPRDEAWATRPVMRLVARGGNGNNGGSNGGSNGGKTGRQS